MLHLKIIIASTRPGRKGIIVGNWFVDFAKENSDFDIEVLDLKKINLPFMDEEEHPKLGNYKNEHTLKWSKKIDEADAFIVVTPEYNYGMPASLKNALDYLNKEWYAKPMGFVSYGGISAGTRSVQHIKLPVTTLGMMPLPEAVNIPFVAEFIKDGKFHPNEITEKAAKTLLSKVKDWAVALKTLREK